MSRATPGGYITRATDPTTGRGYRYFDRTRADAGRTARELREAGCNVKAPIPLADALRADGIDPTDAPTVRRYLGQGNAR